jgi:hypothetical protein
VKGIFLPKVVVETALPVSNEELQQLHDIVTDVVNKITVDPNPLGLRAVVRPIDHDGRWIESVRILITMSVKDRENGEEITVGDVHHILTINHRLKKNIELRTEIVHTVRRGFRNLVMHELDEGFKFEEHRIFDPHKERL